MSEDAKAVKEKNKVSGIFLSLNHISEAANKNKKLSCDIREKLLGAKPDDKSEVKELPKSSGTLDSIEEKLQDILCSLDTSNHHLISVNKEL